MIPVLRRLTLFCGGFVAIASFALAYWLASFASAQGSAAPEITSSGPFSVDEGVTAVATLTADDSDTAIGDLVWSMTGGEDSGAFTLSASGGGGGGGGWGWGARLRGRQRL